MKKNRLIFCIFILLLAFASSVNAQKKRNEGIIRSTLRGLEYEIKAGFNIGGTSPMPLPVEIRSLEKYNPTIAIAIEGNVNKYFGKKWGVGIGLRLENKGMKTDAKVKNYHMEMIAEDGGKMKGAWTGYVKTKVRNSYLTIPVLALYKISPRWVAKAGPYVSFLSEGEFSGSAYNGYLRNENPIGEKVNVPSATYDFSNDIRKFQWGAQIGTEWKAFSHLSIYADLTWGLNSIFPQDFNSITFDMYPIYANLGFAYLF
ncbi:MAG: porin family protein [Bacteroidaceae bacterium]